MDNHDNNKKLIIIKILTIMISLLKFPQLILHFNLTPSPANEISPSLIFFYFKRDIRSYLF